MSSSVLLIPRLAANESPAAVMSSAVPKNASPSNDPKSVKVKPLENPSGAKKLSRLPLNASPP